MSNGPIEPASDLRVLAKTLHEMFIALAQEGFTEAQALTVIGHILAANSGGAA